MRSSRTETQNGNRMSGPGNNWVDVIEPVVRWNTGNGFGPEIPVSNIPPWRKDDVQDNGVLVADMNSDGMDDIVSFRWDPPARSRLDGEGVTFLLSNGDDTFSAVAGPPDPGSRDVPTDVVMRRWDVPGRVQRVHRL